MALPPAVTWGWHPALQPKADPAPRTDFALKGWDSVFKDDRAKNRMKIHLDNLSYLHFFLVPLETGNSLCNTNFSFHIC